MSYAIIENLVFVMNSFCYITTRINVHMKIRYNHMQIIVDIRDITEQTHRVTINNTIFNNM